MIDMLKDVNDFHNLFGFEMRKIGEEPNSNLLNFRLKFMAEKLEQVNVAMGRKDMAEVLNSVVDLTYVALGTAWLLNLNFPLAWVYVHDANMKKERAVGASEQGSDFNIVKPDGWKKPDMNSLILSEDKNMMQDSGIKQEKQLDLVEYLKTKA